MTRRDSAVHAAAVRYLQRTGNAALLPILGLDGTDTTIPVDGAKLRELRKSRGLSQGRPRLADPLSCPAA